MSIFNIYKPVGWTPLEAMNRLRDLNPELKNSPMTYAGRLDPMAEGVLLILSDNDRFDRERHMGLNKTYKAEFLFGFETDTYDALGVVHAGSTVDETRLISELDQLEGNHQIPFPPYSSFKIKGKPLHWWAREGRVDEIEIPLKDMRVLSVSDVTIETRKCTNILESIQKRIDLVHGDFRQGLIIEQWKNELTELTELTVASLTLEVTGGTYIRSLAHELGKKLGCGALLLSLKRTKVAQYDANDSIILT